jgi:hypothetical protein
VIRFGEMWLQENIARVEAGLVLDNSPQMDDSDESQLVGPPAVLQETQALRLFGLASQPEFLLKNEKWSCECLDELPVSAKEWRSRGLIDSSGFMSWGAPSAREKQGEESTVVPRRPGFVAERFPPGVNIEPPVRSGRSFRWLCTVSLYGFNQTPA